MMVLAKDIVIPAGTELKEAPRKTIYLTKHYEALVGFGDDNTATFTLSPDDLPEGIIEER